MDVSLTMARNPHPVYLSLDSGARWGHISVEDKPYRYRTRSQMNPGPTCISSFKGTCKLLQKPAVVVSLPVFHPHFLQQARCPQTRPFERFPAPSIFSVMFSTHSAWTRRREFWGCLCSLNHGCPTKEFRLQHVRRRSGNSISKGPVSPLRCQDLPFFRQSLLKPTEIHLPLRGAPWHMDTFLI